MRNALLLFLLIALPLAADDSIVASLPNGRVWADVMQRKTSPRAAELNAKLQAAVQSNPERWKSDLRQSSGTLEWDERLGLTRDEYAELQKLTGEAMLVKTGEAQIEFVRNGDGNVSVRGDASLPALAGVVIDANGEAVETSIGRAAERTDITAGAWSGTEWKLEGDEDALTSGASVKLTVGRLAQDGRGILLYDAKKPPARASYILVFPLGR